MCKKYDRKSTAVPCLNTAKPHPFHPGVNSSVILKIKNGKFLSFKKATSMFSLLARTYIEPSSFLFMFVCPVRNSGRNLRFFKRQLTLVHIKWLILGTGDLRHTSQIDTLKQLQYPLCRSFKDYSSDKKDAGHFRLEND